MQFELIIFDLDNTLVKTDDLEGFRGREYLGIQNEHYLSSLRAKIHSDPNRCIYSENDITSLLRMFPGIKLSIFTRSPSCYANCVLKECYPNVHWDSIIAFEDVYQSKPNPQGIMMAIANAQAQALNRVLMVGDDKTDVLAAYKAGVMVFIDTQFWEKIDFTIYPLLPDAQAPGFEELVKFMRAPYLFLPIMDRLTEVGGPFAENLAPRITVLNHFVYNNDDRKDFCRINLLGRRFKDCMELRARRSWHEASLQIDKYKDASVFPVAWIEAIRVAIASDWHADNGHPVLVTIIPAKEGRTPRLEALLGQVERSHLHYPIKNNKSITFSTDVFTYLDGARSHHGEYLNANQRLDNVRDHLVVNTQNVRGFRKCIVFDDVVTTGATMYYAHKYLKDAGVNYPVLFSLTKSISDS